jgi:secretion/DNA translocation related TadE-like protein
MISLVLLAGFLIVVILSLTAAIVTRHRAGATADLAALAAVSGSSGSPDCAQAQRVTAANRGRLVACRPLGDGSILVQVESTGGSWALFGTGRGTARASPGPVSPLGSGG